MLAVTWPWRWSTAARGSLRRDGVDQFEVMAGGDLGHDAAVAGVQQALRGDHVRADRAVAIDHGGAGVVAARLDGEDHAVARSGTVRHMISASSRLSW